MGQIHKAAKKGEIAEGEGRVIEIGDEQIALFNVGGTFYAIDNLCQHAGGPLGEGTLAGTTVTCPWHQWEYNVTNGACFTNPNVTQKSYPVKIEGDDILIEI